MSVNTSNVYGKISISDQVLAKVAAYAALECYGIVETVPRRFTDSLAELFKKPAQGRVLSAEETAEFDEYLRNKKAAQIRRLESYCVWQIIVLTYEVEFFERLGFERIDKRQIMHKLYRGCANCSKHESPFTCPEVAMARTGTPAPAQG